MIIEIIKQSILGKTVNRALMNIALMDYEVGGKAIDLGGGSVRSSYYNYLKKGSDLDLYSSDISNSRRPDFRWDLEEALPAQDESYDSVLCFNILEHIFNHQQLISESYRILRNGGNLVGYVPFLVKFHPDPSDFFRYTGTALERVIEGAGFRDVRIRFIGFGPLTAAWSQVEFFIPSFLRWIFTILFIYLDRILIKIKPVFRGKYALGYVFSAKK